MKHKQSITILSSIIILLAVVASTSGIFSGGGPGPYQIETVRGETVTVYGKGLYMHMSQNVAPQGVAQDYITLGIAVPLLLVSLLWARRGSLKGQLLLAGTLGYFLVTYLFYLVMGMYNVMFLAYVILLGASFFAFSQTLLSIDINNLRTHFAESTPVTWAGGFLIFNSIAIALMWLGIVIPPLLDGSIIPVQVEHYTTLIVQGLDLGLLLPLSFVSGLLLIRRKPLGYLLAPVYLVFLSILMTALTAKVIAMGILGQNIMPAVVIIPLFTLSAIAFSVIIIKYVKEPVYEYA
ncbi:hypothetical protein NC796_22540 [Aliifodinibius sp. S!AR15-10]|uniref:hypothetical protein n=1 Tax=Aliifodinibius sp. S!AR15-10 TaxID=2950437 RepID=UPI002856991E|nr:hypothetical protein [Aliifodinibius sp. S!AR15-10]MDR8393950.1 hypothetical protein [Aliifodinibius sp. S!AR15-10]